MSPGKSVDHPKEFDVRLLFPGKSDQEVSEALADYFNEVSREFDPLSPRPDSCDV